MVNPYLCYALAFGLALAMYPLGWSDAYPALSSTLVTFLLSTIVIHIFLATRFARKTRAALTIHDTQGSPALPFAITGFLHVLWAAEFFHAGGIPLFLIILNHSYDYRLFGIPSLHVFVVTFSSFYTIFLFHRYLSTGSRRYLVLFVTNLSAAILIYNRGMFLFNLSASVFLFVIFKGKISARTLFTGLGGAVLIAYLFGVMGSLRVSNQSGVPYTNDLFLEIGQANDAFRESIVPDEFFWVYIYATSPLANLEQNMKLNRPEKVEASSFLKWLNNEVLFDFISKRLNARLGTDRAEIETIEGPFNATTVYAASFTYLGFAGLALMLVFIILLPVLYLRLIPPESPFFLTGLVTLNTIFFFMVFDNMIRFTGLSFQIVYPIVFHHMSKRLPVLKKIFP